MKTLLLLCTLLLPVTTLAADPAPAPVAPAVAAPSSSLDTNHDGKVDAAETAAATAAETGVKDVAAGVAEVTEAAKALKDADGEMPKGLLLAVLLGAIFKLLLSSLKMVSKFAPWFQSKDGKRILKYSTIGLGAAAALTANLGFGMGWMDAGALLLSGPLAVAFHEYTSDSKQPEAPKA